MNVSPHDKKSLDAFLLSITPTIAAYEHSVFSFLAIKTDATWTISQARLHLMGVPPANAALVRFESSNIRAGRYSIKHLCKSPTDFITTLFTSRISTPDGELCFPGDADGRYSVFFNALHNLGAQSQRRHGILTIFGANRPIINVLDIDWELKANATPFDTLAELNTEFGVPSDSGQQSLVEIAAYNSVEIDSASTVTGEKGLLGVRAVGGVDPKLISIGYRLISNGKVSKRGRVSGHELNWSLKDLIQCGRTEIDVPKGAVVHCIASYAGIAHHHYWVSDPSTVQNPRRAVHQAFDSNLETMQELLKISGKGNDARDFEHAIAWLLWMLGFSVSHLGGTRKTSDAIDLLATTPKGNFLVIECTTGLLKMENKFPNLVARAEQVRNSLVNSGNPHLKVLPVMVTNKSRQEIAAEIEAAEKMGVLVVTNDRFANLISRTYYLPDADELYKLAEEKITQAETRWSNSSPFTG